MVILNVNPFDASNNQYDCESENFGERNAPSLDDGIAPATTTAVKNSAFPFRCEKCLYKSHSRELFDRHVSRHSMDRPFECTVCDYTTFDHLRFVGHLVTHQQTKVIQCPFCPYATYVSSMKYHIQEHRAMEIFDCSDCEFSTNNRKSLTRHTGIYHDPMFKCEYCEPLNLTRMTKQALFEHWDEVHGIREVLSETIDDFAQKNNPTLSNPDSNRSESYPDLIVKSESGQYPEDGDTISQHSQSLTGTQSDEEFEGFTDHDIERTYDCPACEFSSPLKVLLKFHILSMHTKNISCQYCSAVMSKHALIEHSKTAHGMTVSFDGNGLQKARRQPSDRPNFKTQRGEHNVPAKIVDDDFYEPRPSWKGAGTWGERSYVTGRIKPFTCTLCDFSSHNEWSLTCHMKFMHTIKYHCNHCPAIMSKYDIIKHSSSEHGVEIRPRGPSGLKEATDTESQVVRQVSGREMAMDRFTEHFMDDTQDQKPNVQNDALETSNPFACSICVFVAKSNSYLMKHMDKFHRKKYRCPHCPAVMTKHKLIDHGWNAHRALIKAKNRFLKEVGRGCCSSDSDDNMDGKDSEYQREQWSMERMVEQKSVPAQNHLTETVCSFCGFSNPVPSNVQNHIELMHVIKYHCEHCLVIMPKYNLIQHYENVHGLVISHRTYPLKKAGEATGGPAFENAVVKTEPVQETSHGPSGLIKKADQNDSRKHCSLCKYKSVVAKDVKQHEERMHRLKFQCDRCPVVMVKYDLLRHVQIKHGIVLPRNHSFREVRTLSRGRSEDQMDTAQSDQECSEFDASSFNGNSSINAACLFCDHVSRRRGNMDIHVERMHTRKYRCEVCSAVMTKYDLIQHYANVHGAAINSRGIGVQFVEASPKATGQMGKPDPAGPSPHPGENQGTKEPSRRIGDAESEPCSLCDFSTKSSVSMDLHLENWHKRKYVCNDCPAVMTKHEIILHSKDVHGVTISRMDRPSQTIKLAEQGAVGVGETDEDHLGNQLTGPGFKVEAREEGFHCDLCDFSSSYRKSILIHVVNMHRKKYACNDCSAVLTKHELIVHSKDAHGVEIPFNGRGYVFKHVREGSNDEWQTQKSSKVGSNSEIVGRKSEPDPVMLPNANRTLEGDAPGRYKCSDCEFTSLYPYNLKIHFDNFHKKLFHCNNCSVVKTKFELIRHTRNEHNIQVAATRKARFREYHPESGEADATDSEANSYSTTAPGGVEHELKSSENGESNFADSIRGPAWSTLKPDISADQTVDQEKSILAEENGEMLIPNSGRGRAAEFFRDLNPDSNDNTGKSEMVKIMVDKFQCPMCEYSSRNNKYHVLVHFEALHRKKYSCVRCSVILTKYEMIHHYETEHDVVIKSFYGSGRRWFREVDLGSDSADKSAFAEVVQDVPPSAGINTDDNDESMTIIREGAEFKCSICGFSTSFRFNLKPHFESFHKNKYSCNRCSLVTTKYGMVCHYENVHRFVIPNFGKGNIAPYCKAVRDVSEDIDMPLFAGMVETVMGNSATPEMDGHEEVGAAMDSKSLGRGVDADDSSIMEGHWIAGSNCDARLIDIIQVGGSFKCSICNHTANHKANIQTHVEALHRRKYSCNRCSVVLTKYEMIQHYKTDHNVEFDQPHKGRKSQYFVAVDLDPGANAAIDESLVESQCAGDTNPPVLAHSSSDSVAINGYTATKNENVAESEGFSFQEERAFRCALCEFSTTTNASLQKHLMSLHTKRFSCNRCKVIMTKFAMLHHFETDHGVEIPYNGRGTTIQYFTPIDSDVSVHPTSSATISASEVREEEPEVCNDEGRVVHQEGVKDLVCDICEFSTKYEHSMKNHMVNFHKRIFLCDHCQAGFTKHSLVEHCKNVHGVTISGFSRTLREVTESSANDGHPNGDNARPSPGSSGGLTMFQCSSCNYSSKLRVHLRLHTKNMHTTKHCCSLCKEVMTKHELLDHHKNVHDALPSSDNMDPVRSKECEDVSEAEAMQARNIFSCTECSFSTKAKWYLKDHMVKFHQTKYNCTHCSSVLTKHNLIKHCKNFHGVVYSSRQPFQEAKDTRSFSSANGARRGCVVKGSLKMGRCTPTTSDATNTTNVETSTSHVDQETGRAQCSECDFSTPHGWYLNEHMESFHRKKYNCGQCSAVMTKHELFKHSEERHGVILKRSGKLPSAYKVSRDNAKSKFETPENKNRKKFPCVKCLFSSFHPFGLKRHVKMQHTIKYPCQRCSAVMTRHELIKHYRSVHSAGTPGNDPNESTIQPSGDHTYSVPVQGPTESQVVNPKFRAQLQTAEVIQSPAFQPVVTLERLQIDVDDLHSSFSIVENPESPHHINTASALIENPKFHDPSL